MSNIWLKHPASELTYVKFTPQGDLTSVQGVIHLDRAISETLSTPAARELYSSLRLKGYELVATPPPVEFNWWMTQQCRECGRYHAPFATVCARCGMPNPSPERIP